MHSFIIAEKNFPVHAKELVCLTQCKLIYNPVVEYQNIVNPGLTGPIEIIK